MAGSLGVMCHFTKNKLCMDVNFHFGPPATFRVSSSEKKELICLIGTFPRTRAWQNMDIILLLRCDYLGYPFRFRIS